MRHLFLVFLLLFVATASFANGSEDPTWVYDEATSTLTISGTGAMPDYGWGSTPWWDIQNKVQNVVIEEGITTIGGYAFYLCSALRSIVIPDGITAIGEQAFSFCSSLLTITLPESLTVIDSYSFYSCGLTSIVLPNSVESIGEQAFAFCNSLGEITFPNNLKSISSDSFYNTAWYWDLPDDYFVYVKNILWFYKDERFGVEKGNMDLTVTDGTVSIMEGLLYSNRYLVSLTLPASLRLIEDYAFASCTNLASITVHAETPPQIESGTFSDVKKSIPLHVPAASVEAYRNAEYWKEFTNIQSITVNIPKVSAAYKVYTQGNRIVTERMGNASISVYDLLGRTIKIDNPACITVPCPGVYLVKINNESVKVLVK